MHTYTQSEIEEADGVPVDIASENQFFIGPFENSDAVMAFKHMLDGLIYLQYSLEEQIERGASNTDQAVMDLDAIQRAVDFIKKELKDPEPSTLFSLLGKENSLYLECGGYWPEFVTTSFSEWRRWAERYIEVNAFDVYWDDRYRAEKEDDEEGESEDAGEDDLGDILDPRMDYIEEHIMHETSIPENIYDPDFVEHLLFIVAPVY